MLFSKLGEVLLFILGLLYVGDKYLDSFIDVLALDKNTVEEKEPPLTDTAKRMYS